MQNVNLKVAGLYSFPNRLSSIPQGALLVANNIVINRDSIAESRRGYKIYGSAINGNTGAGNTANTSHQLLTYKNRLFRHWGAGAGTTLEYDSSGSGTFSAFSLTASGTTTNGSIVVNGFTTTSRFYIGMSISGTGIPLNTVITEILNNNTIYVSNNATASGTSSFTLTWNIAELVTGLRIKGIEQNGNFYFTSSNGIQKISASSTSDLSTAVIQNAGGIQALDIKATLNSQQGFFTQESLVAYRVVWGINDANQNLILGAPSGRYVISNPLTPLLAPNFNALLSALDTVNVAGGIDTQTYLSTLKVPTNVAPDLLRTNLLSLAAKLDNDITGFNISAASWSGNITTLTLSSSPVGVIAVGDSVLVSGVNPSAYNGVFVVLSVSASTITYTQITNPGSYSSSGAINQHKYEAITPIPTFNTIPNTDQLVAMQTFFDAIVNNLKLETTSVVNDPTIFYSLNSTQSGTVNLSFPIPQGITTAHFYQVYRTLLTKPANNTSLSNDGSGNPYDPGDECLLAYEANPTNSDLNNGYISILDITPDSFLGANLYTNPNSGEGILQSNYPPPLAQDITSYKGYTFFGNTSTVQRLNLSMLSVSDLVSNTSTLTIQNGSSINTYTFVSGLAEIQTITTVADVAGSLNSKYFTINSANNTTKYYYYFTNGSGIDPAPAGYVLGSSISFTNNDSANAIASHIVLALQQNSDFIATANNPVVTVYNAAVGICAAAANGTASPGFSYVVTTAGVGEDAANQKVIFSPVGNGLITSLSVANNTVITTQSAHGLVTGQVVQISATDSTPVADGNYAITVTGANTFTIPVIVTTAGTIGAWDLYPIYTPSQQITETSQSLIRVINQSGGEVIYASYLSGPTEVPGQMLFQARHLSSAAFYITVDNSSTGGQFNPALPTSGNSVISTNEVKPNRLYYSKFQQPDAVPLVNYTDIGPQDKAIKRVLGLRDNLYVLKEEGVYRLSGFSAPFSVYPFDFSTYILAPDSAVILNNLIYFISNQGISTISDTQVAVISRPIEDEIVPQFINPNFSTATFGVSYESDRAYYLFTTTKLGDVGATQCFRFNTFTQTWTVLNLTKRCGIVNSFDDKLYLGAIDVSYIEQERKSLDRTDYADREVASTIAANSISGTNITLPSLTNISAYDIGLQTQYVSISEFNRLLTKLDRDSLLTSHNYVSTLSLLPGAVLNDAMDALITKIANDPGRLSVGTATSAASYTALTPTSTDFATIQTTYNSLISLLNNDDGVGYSNYMSSSGTVDFEFPVVSTNSSTASIITNYSYPLLAGPVTIFNHIPTDVQFVPQTLTDVSITKQASEGTFIFEGNSFTNATVLYSTDLSADFESISINGVGNGTFGNSVFGNGVFGGSGSAVPFRTFIPREKQRCRYINCRFQHFYAREIFSLYGLSITFNPISTRGWR